MSTIVEIYTSEVFENLKPLFANWEPGRPVKVGDFGELRGRSFIHLGNIKKFGIKVKQRPDPASDHKFFASRNMTEVKFNAKGSTQISGVVNAKANLEVKFSSDRAVMFNAADCKYSMVEDKVQLGREVMGLYKKGDWHRGWAVVTDLVKAGATTIAVSGGDSASIVFEATGDVDKIDLADASIGLTASSSTNIGYQVVALANLIPLVGLCKIQSAFLWWGTNFKPLYRSFGDPRVVDVLENSDLVRTEESEEALFFGQMR